MNSCQHVQSDRSDFGMGGMASHREPDIGSVLLAMAGHDLRQPLQIIQSTHERLGRGLRTKSELRLLKSGQKAIDHLTEQLEQLVTALRVSEHGKQLKLKPVRLDPLIRRVCDENEEIASQRGISIRSVPTDVSVLSDVLLLTALLRNLVSNAIKYTPHSGRVLLGCRRAGAQVRVDVYDTGIGIEREQIHRIFEPFVRVDSTRRDGLGIGLFIVRQAVDLLGHRIDCASRPSRGSRFSIFIEAVEPTPMK